MPVRRSLHPSAGPALSIHQTYKQEKIQGNAPVFCHMPIKPNCSFGRALVRQFLRPAVPRGFNAGKGTQEEEEPVRAEWLDVTMDNRRRNEEKQTSYDLFILGGGLYMTARIAYS
ncbi:hypothetical protein P7K49_008413 [Saguinus oedipus]|uniref:Uncharacterized protein n=1 Tax=Saguinus oedipus TaxID=9490 RepID=A0ABQ9VXQ5_SAGOE|nr:hypothetical protein P7K49_008413 [Saguinus oedipus]